MQCSSMFILIFIMATLSSEHYKSCHMHIVLKQNSTMLIQFDKELEDLIEVFQSAIFFMISPKTFILFSLLRSIIAFTSID